MRIRNPKNHEMQLIKEKQNINKLNKNSINYKQLAVDIYSQYKKFVFCSE
jgi:hypothetical protein